MFSGVKDTRHPNKAAASLHFFWDSQDALASTPWFVSGSSVQKKTVEESSALIESLDN